METIELNMNVLWIVIATFLVFFMQAGFTLLEAGLVRAKNSINVAMKNVIDLLITTIVFALVGFALMFGSSSSGWIGLDGFFLRGLEEDPYNWAFLLFQIVFAGTAATIVSGAIAERVKFGAYIIGTIMISAIIYPIFGHWAWGSLWSGEDQGWLEALGFIDFAGSTVVHSIGGWVALAATIIVGPRIGKYTFTGETQKFAMSNAVLAVTGVFILWLGWFGFNAGSTGIADVSIAVISLNTHFGAVSGGTAALIISWVLDKRPRVEDILNGILAGLVSVTAGANILTPEFALISGAIGGILVIFSLRLIDSVFKIDDAIGAIAVHGVCGAWGTLALALFAPLESLVRETRIEQIGVQLLGIGTAFVWAFGMGLIIYGIMKFTMKIRVEKEEEEAGLNVSEHGASISVLDTIVAMNEIAAAKGDLTKKIHYEAGEDMAELNEAFNTVLSTLNDLVHQVKTQTANVLSTTDNVLSLSEDSKQSASLQMTEIDETYSYVTQSEKWLEKEIEVENQVIAEIQQAFSSIEQIGNQLNWIQKEISDISSFVHNVGELNEDVHQKMTLFNENISKITNYANESGQMIDIITDVSEQINLLSLNASIEAARAGESGRGFTIVANEIKKLALKSKSSTEDIRKMIQQTTRETTAGFSEVIELSKKIDLLSTELSKMPKRFNTIDEKVYQVSHFMNSFLVTLERVNQDTVTIQGRRYEQQDSFKKMTGRMEQVYQNMKTNLELSFDMVEKIKTMKEQNEELQHSVSQFVTAK
ncbi:ammonium transporter [Metabacillus endolithicus]|uniref:Ammonium transporter n=1 Tax=Metabacillus endolithicus TaxID=1535204 RepID=A0ABW5C277_9BACI|nr:ammonium transporter [Metabacillus endolithicus]UPG62310.1 ammonium transporter [Metabacillus endolithicus]